MYFDMKSLEKGLSLLENKADFAVRMYGETQAKSLEGTAKKNAPWTDRSGEARRRLRGTLERYEKGWRIKLSHGVNYGLWLELAHNKNFAAIAPTIHLMSSQVLKGLERLMDRLGKTNT